jgi:hypothetical protein
MTWQRGDTGLADISLSGIAVAVELEQDDFPGSFAVSVNGLDAGVSEKADIRRLRLAVDALAVEAISAIQGEARGKANLSTNAFSVSFASTARDWRGMLGIADGEAGIADLAFQMGKPALTLTISDNLEGADGTYRFGSGGLTGVGELTAGRGTFSTELRQAQVASTPENAGNPLRGEISVGVIQGRLSLPLVPSDTPAEGAFRVAFEELTADEIVWSYFDSGKALKRDPGSGVLDLEATLQPQARLSAALFAGIAVPFEVQNLIVNEISASFLGANATAHGDLEMLPALGIPIGEIKVQGAGLVGGLGALDRAGLIDGETLETADALLQVYARPREGIDTWETEVSFSERGIDVNGLPIQ